MFLLKGSTDFLHCQPKEDEASHLQVRVGNVSARILGHFYIDQKIVGTHGESLPITTPPVPWPEASTKPM